MAMGQRLVKVFSENTVQTKKLIRILEAAGFRDPQDLAQAARSGLQVPQAQRRAGQDVFASVATHLMKAFPPEDIRDMAEEFFDGLVRNQRRRRR